MTETIRSLNICRQKSGERFMECLLMLHVWIQSHFQCKKSAFTKPYLPNSLPVKEFYDSEWSGPKTNERWIAFLQNISDKQIVWLALWMFPYFIDVERNFRYNCLVYGSNQLCTFNGGKTVQRKTVYTHHERFKVVGILVWRFHSIKGDWLGGEVLEANF